jgi:hypothetical protein
LGRAVPAAPVHNFGTNLGLAKCVTHFAVEKDWVHHSSGRRVCVVANLAPNTNHRLLGMRNRTIADGRTSVLTSFPTTDQRCAH